MKWRRAVVTGGAGVIGRSLVGRLRDAGVSCRVVDLKPRPPWMWKEVDYVQADLAQSSPEVITEHRPEVVFHLAAAFERSKEDPVFWEVNAHHNVKASQVVLQGAMLSPSLRRYVFASSYLIYDPGLYLSPVPAEAVVLDEEAAIRPRNACGAAKLLHEKEVALAARTEHCDFSHVSARIYRVFGRGSRDVVSRWVRSALRGDEIQVFGAESRFDYVFADDVA